MMIGYVLDPLQVINNRERLVSHKVELGIQIINFPRQIKAYC